MFEFDVSDQTRPRTTFEERKEEGFNRWSVSSYLFGVGCDIYDFVLDYYKYFLDNVKSLTDLVEGLRQLSPFADDALEVAERMSEKDFRKFKHALPGEHRKSVEDMEGEQPFLFRELKPPKMPRKFFTLLIPKRFITAGLTAEEFGTCLGVALIQIMEYERANPPLNL